MKKSFTLIEILVVIAIIGILAALILVSVRSSMARARDAQTKNDLLQSSKALELYYSDNESYPASSGGLSGTPVNLDTISSELTPKYIKSIPTAPKSPYLYRSDGKMYELFGKLERLENGQDGWKVTTSERTAAGYPTSSPPFSIIAKTPNITYVYSHKGECVTFSISLSAATDVTWEIDSTKIKTDSNVLYSEWYGCAGSAISSKKRFLGWISKAQASSGIVQSVTATAGTDNKIATTWSWNWDLRDAGEETYGEDSYSEDSAE